MNHLISPGRFGRIPSTWQPPSCCCGVTLQLLTPLANPLIQEGGGGVQREACHPSPIQPPTPSSSSLPPHIFIHFFKHASWKFIFKITSGELASRDARISITPSRPSYPPLTTRCVISAAACWISETNSQNVCLLQLLSNQVFFFYHYFFFAAFFPLAVRFTSAPQCRRFTQAITIPFTTLAIGIF